jgi:hypothetical protein
MKNSPKLPASFRDPSGFLFFKNQKLYRQVNQIYQENFDRLIESGLYDHLVKSGMLVPHAEVDLSPPEPELAYKVIQPEELRFISYPYEWCFSQLKDAALLTLEIQKRALKHGMSLKDSSNFNIQFRLDDAKPVLIDTLSFEIYQEGQPWVAYRQYCQHFLAPLTLMAYNDVRLSQLLRVYIDGIPLDLASRLLPRRTRFNFGLLSHIHLHATAQKRYAAEDVSKVAQTRTMSKTSLLGLIDSLERTTEKLELDFSGTEWAAYYEDTNYTPAAAGHKKELVAKYVEQVNPKLVWDLGGNVGVFSRLASEKGIPTITFDLDTDAVEMNYREIKANKETNLLPLALDLTNPSPDIGWGNRERRSLSGRSTPDLIMALALIHHLSISNNVPFEMVAEYFASLSPWLILEFIPKSDSQVQRLLATREDIFPNYSFEGLEAAFKPHYDIAASEDINESQRRMYLMKRK